MFISKEMVNKMRNLIEAGYAPCTAMELVYPVYGSNEPAPSCVVEHCEYDAHNGLMTHAQVSEWNEPEPTGTYDDPTTWELV